MKTYLKVITLILFIVPFLVVSTPIAYAFPQNSHHYKFTGITYDPVSFKKIGNAKANIKYTGQMLYLNIILNNAKYRATIPTSKLIVYLGNKCAIKHFTGKMMREDQENFYSTIYLELDSYNKLKAITGIINDYSLCKNGIGFIALEAGFHKEIKLPTPTNGKTYQSKVLTATSDPQPGDKGWLGYGDNGQINGGAVGTYDDQTNKLGGIEAGEVGTVWFPVWIDPYYRVGDIPSMAKLTHLHVKVWAGDTDIDFGNPIFYAVPNQQETSVSFSFTVTVGYGPFSCSVTVSYTAGKVSGPQAGEDSYGRAYVEWGDINLGTGIWPFISYPKMDDHRSSDTAFGVKLWLHAMPGASQGNHTCYVRFKFDWLAYMVGWIRGYWVAGSTDWLEVSFIVYVYW